MQPWLQLKHEEAVMIQKKRISQIREDVSFIDTIYNKGKTTTSF